jgi:DNA-binding response OmpR family regulator
MLRILVVDDEPMVLESIRLTLTCSGFEVVTAVSGADALAKLVDAGFDALVTDRKMPVMTGEQLAVAVKERWPTMPILMLTGFPPARKPPAVDVIVLKPFSTADLRNAIERVAASAAGSP